MHYGNHRVPSRHKRSFVAVSHYCSFFATVQQADVNTVGLILVLILWRRYTRETIAVVNVTLSI